MSKTIRYNPDSFHKDARESNINHRKVERLHKNGKQSRPIDGLLQEELQYNQAENDEEGRD